MRHALIVLCERSGIVRDAFRARGVDAWSCDVEPCERGSPYHLRADARAVAYGGDFDAFIAHPECRFLSGSGLHWNRRYANRAEQSDEAVEFAVSLWHCPMQRGVLENPKGLLSTRIRPADQIVQPYQFGDDASKSTALWLRGGFRPLRPTQYVAPRLVCCGYTLPPGAGRRGCPRCEGVKVAQPRWSNQADSGQNKLGETKARSMDRARTYPGVAAAMAEQWSPLLLQAQAAA